VRDSRNNFQGGNNGRMFSEITENRYQYVMVFEKRTQGKGMDSERFTTRSSSTLIPQG